MKRIPTSLILKTTEEPVAATLVDGVTRELLEKAELAWATLRLEGAKRIFATGGDVPEHFKWDWRRKSSKLDLLANRCFGIECEDEMQGLMLVNTPMLINTTKCESRLIGQRGKPLVYVDYIETAPWNLKMFTPRPKYGGVGVRLIEAAVRFSVSEGYEGRIGLHSLPQSEHFYESVCGMTRGEIDLHYEKLCWFELTANNVKKFLGGQP